MKQKYTISKNDADNTMTISEFAELDKEMLSLLCEQSYPQETILQAIEGGVSHVVSAIHTVNLYPPRTYAERIAEAVIDLYRGEEATSSVDVFFDDQVILAEEMEAEEEVIEEMEEDSENLDELLEEDLEDEFDDSESINPSNAPLKIAEDESLDVDDES
jgi:hypothetical protein